MKLINLRQGAKEWYEYRATRIGASDFALFCAHKKLTKNLFGENLTDNFYKKINYDKQEKNEFLESRKAMEPMIAAEYYARHNILLNNAVAESDDNSRIFASLDGLDFDDTIIVEYKTTSKDDAEYEQLIDYYTFQCIHQIYVTGINNCKLFFYNVKTKKYSEFDVEVTLTKQEWLNLCNEYLQLFDASNNEEQIKLLKEYDKIKSEVDKLKAQIDELEAGMNEIKPLLKTGVYGNFTVKEIKRETYKYSQYFKDINIEQAIQRRLEKHGDKYKTTSLSLKITNKDK